MDATLQANGKPATDLEKALALAIREREEATHNVGVLLQTAEILYARDQNIRPAGKPCNCDQVNQAIEAWQAERVRALLRERTIREAMEIVADLEDEA